MTLPYSRSFNAGRQSELLYNEELHKNFESTRHLLDVPEGKNSVPEAKLDGSLWLNRKTNELKSYHQSSKKWKNIFAEKFQIVDQITNQLPPESPVIGQLWLYNDVLMYYDGATWKPVKALEQDGSQFNLSVFENFVLISPLWKIGNTIVKDEAIAAYEKKEKQYIQGKIDDVNNADLLSDGTKWQLGHKCDVKEVSIGDLHMEGKSQLLVPNIDVDRVFVDDKIDFNYEAPTKVCIEYPRDYLLHKTPSLVHINPGKLTKMEKRLIMIDRANPMIKIPAANTEYYGFRKNDIYGRFLLPADPKDPQTKDYEILSDGIYLSYNASQTYDYILAITYEFSWFKSTGSLARVNNTDNKSSYYVQDYLGPMNVFVEGMNLEDPYFDEDNLSQVVTINEDTSKLEVSMMHSTKREYGFVRQIDLQNRAVIKTLRQYKRPLVFMNGEAVHPILGDVEVDGNYIYVKGGQRNMAWSVIELWDEKTGYSMEMNPPAAGIVQANPTGGDPVIPYDTTKILSTDDMVLFIDGLLIKKEDIIRDSATGEISVIGLKAGQDYILLQDKYHNLYDETKIMPALPVGNLSESLVYMNGRLLCNDTAVATTKTEAQAQVGATNGEVKLFLKSDLNRTDGVFKTYDEVNEKWVDMTFVQCDEVKSFAYSYENTMRAVKFNIVTTKQDIINVFAFNFANAIEHSLIIRNLPYSFDEYDEHKAQYDIAVKSKDAAAIAAAKAKLDEVTTARSDFSIKETYIPNIGSLSVWVNGIRQYEVNEYLDGTGFSLPKKVAGIVTYVIENPENGATTVAEREILTKENIVPNTINVYRTTKPLYPGRVLLYVNGVRQPQEAFTILDNYTILFQDKSTMLTGNPNNFPNETIILRNEPATIHRSASDKILVEVKQDFERQENFIHLDETTNYDIGIDHYELPINILEASDEIMIFIDGLFFGLRNLFGYKKDRYRGVITLTDADIVQRVISDPLATYLLGNPAAMLAYKNTHNGNAYVPKTKDMIFDWR